MKFLSNIHKGELYAAISGLMYGLIGYFGVQIINAGNTISNMSAWRYIVASIIAAMIFFSKNKKITINKSDLFKIFIYGAIFYAPCSMVFFYASEYIGTGISMVIFFTYPAIVILLNRMLYKTQINRLYYLSIAIIFLGMILLADFSDAQLNMIGIIFALFSALGYGCYITACQNISNTDPVLSTCVVSMGCAFAGIVFAIYQGTFYIPSGAITWLNIIGMASICTALPILLLLEAMKYISSTKASILSVLEPVFVVIFGMILLNEQISTMQGLGVVIVLGGALLALRCKR